VIGGYQIDEIENTRCRFDRNGQQDWRRSACNHCGIGQYWTVKGSNGAKIGGKDTLNSEESNYQRFSNCLI